ncbi:MAG: ABC transporter permease [Acidimicrobiia bacterium]|nr:ABC transporter permease [Acidimicrobiia bacterium]
MPARSPDMPGGSRDSASFTEGHDTDQLFQEAPAELYADAVASVGDVEAEIAGEAVKRRLGVEFWIATGVFVLIVVAVFAADWLPLQDPDASDKTAPNATPSSDHWLGTDQNGRDLLSRVIHGGQVPITIGFSAAMFGMVLGGLGGLVAGYYRGKAETGIMWATDVALAFPPIVLAMTLVFFWGNDVWQMALILGLIAIPPVIRIARANTLLHGQREFVLAAYALGSSRRRILRRDVLPNVMPSLVSFSLIVVALVIVAEASLAVVGISVDENTWGQMINGGAQVIKDFPHVVFVPCAALFLTVLSLNLAGDRLRAYYDVREGGL